MDFPRELYGILGIHDRLDAVEGTMNKLLERMEEVSNEVHTWGQNNEVRMSTIALETSGDETLAKKLGRL